MRKNAQKLSPCLNLSGGPPETEQEYLAIVRESERHRPEYSRAEMVNARNVAFEDAVRVVDRYLRDCHESQKAILRALADAIRALKS